MRRSLAVLLLLVATASPALAVKEWHDYYLAATQDLIPKQRWAEALRNLEDAVQLKPAPERDARTYGVEFVDYHPYLYMGLCQLRLGSFAAAQKLFDLEEQREAIKRNRRGLYQELQKLRKEAEDGERQLVAQQVRQQVDRLRHEATELAQARKYPDSLTRLAQAQALASALDPATQRAITEMQKRVQGEATEAADAAARSQRIEQALASAFKLIEDGRPAEASVRFEEALALDPHNARAAEGRRDAQERIRASTTRQSREAAFHEGQALFEAGRYEDAMKPLTEAAAEPANREARNLLEKARRILEGVQAQKELRVQLDRLMAEGEQLLGQGKFPEAQVDFQGVLSRDPSHVRARERLSVAERMTGEALFARWLPNRAPVLTIVEPRSLELDVEAPTLAVVGVASDDRGLAKIEFLVQGRLVAAQAPPPRTDSGDSARSVRFERKLDLVEGPNEIRISATDTMGLERSARLRVTRKPGILERPEFLPAVFGGALGLIGAGLLAQRSRRRRALANRFNPYIAGAPVIDDDMFFGREKLLARMLNMVHGNSLMITGERRIGKTTFLYHLKKVLAADEATEFRFFPVFTDLQGVPEEAFFHSVMADVLEELRPPAETGLRFGPDAGAYGHRDFSHDLQCVIEALKKRTPKRPKLALLIDEVDVLNGYSEQINQRLRSIFMRTFSENIVAIMSGVGIRRNWKSEVSPWYNFFDEVTLTPFSREEAEALIREPVQGVFRWQPEAVERILALSELKPYLIQKFCIHAVNRMLEAGRTTVRSEDVEAVRDAVLIEAHDGAAQAPA